MGWDATSASIRGPDEEVRFVYEPRRSLGCREGTTAYVRYVG